MSIGYTPAVAAALSDVADVQHSPWGGDGGACETAYGEQCLDYFLSSPSGVQLVPDVLYFNWGLHNIGTTVVPGQGSTPQLYLPSLTNIVRRLKALASSNGGKPKLIFGITSPMLCDAASDDKVLGLNKQAVALMQSNQIPTVDLHAAVVGKCGPVPTSTCFNHSDCFCPHCTVRCGAAATAPAAGGPAHTAVAPCVTAVGGLRVAGGLYRRARDPQAAVAAVHGTLGGGAARAGPGCQFSAPRTALGVLYWFHRFFGARRPLVSQRPDGGPPIATIWCTVDDVAPTNFDLDAGRRRTCAAMSPSPARSGRSNASVNTLCGRLLA